MRKTSTWLIVLALLLTFGGIRAFAQANSELTGVVTDTTGAAVPGASVVLTDPATAYVRATTSGSTGLYDFPGLNPGNYDLKVTAKGFKAYSQNGIVVNVSGAFRVDVRLTIGAETTTVTVEADALTVQTESNVVSTLITSEDITSLATENRNIVNLAALGMGVSSQLPDSNSLGAFGANFSIEFNGLREAHNIWLIDGGESADRGGGGGMQILPSQEAIAEFQMMTSNYPPDYGISSGATISISLKSGTKDFHGAAWEDNRATAYNANSFFNKYNGATQCHGRQRITTSTASTSAARSTFRTSTTPTRTRASSSSTRSGARRPPWLPATTPRSTQTDVPSSANIKTVGGVTGLHVCAPHIRWYSEDCRPGGSKRRAHLGLLPQQVAATWV